MVVSLGAGAGRRAAVGAADHHRRRRDRRAGRRHRRGADGRRCPRGYTSQLTIGSVGGRRLRTPRPSRWRRCASPGSTCTARRSPRGRRRRPASTPSTRQRHGPAASTGAEGAPRCAAGPGHAGPRRPSGWTAASPRPSGSTTSVFATAVARPGPALDALLTEVRGTVPVDGQQRAGARPAGQRRRGRRRRPDHHLAGRRRTTGGRRSSSPGPSPARSTRCGWSPTPDQAAATPTAVSIETGGLPRTCGSPRTAPSGSPP